MGRHPGGRPERGAIGARGGRRGPGPPVKERGPYGNRGRPDRQPVSTPGSHRRRPRTRRRSCRAHDGDAGRLQDGTPSHSALGRDSRAVEGRDLNIRKQLVRFIGYLRHLTPAYVGRISRSKRTCRRNPDSTGRDPRIATLRGVLVRSKRDRRSARSPRRSPVRRGRLRTQSEMSHDHEGTPFDPLNSS